MTDTKNFSAHISSLIQDSGFQFEAAQIQAKALLREITDQLPQYHWRYIARRVIRNIGIATFELGTISKDDPTRIDSLSEEARKLALVWESLAQLEEATTRETALLNAAVNYELAGYQANSMCIAKRLVNDELAIENPSIIDMTALFLDRRFLQLLELTKAIQVEPEVKGELELSLIEAMGNALVGNAFEQAVQFFLRGDESTLEKASQVFENAGKLFSSLALVEASNLVRSMSTLLGVMKSRSTWTLLSRFAPKNPKWERYLKLLARGTGTDIFRGRSISELWQSQVTAIERGVLNTTSSKIIKMPTSAGKTRIAELAIVHTLVNHPTAKCVYVAPYRALVSELEQSFFNLFSDLGYRVSTATGGYDSDDFEELLFGQTELLVVTPEKLDLLLRAQPEFLESVRLIVLDEAHIVHDLRRGVKFELLLTRLKRKLRHVRFIVLSAVVPQVTLEDFAAWFNASSHEDILTSPWRPSIQRYAKFEWRGQTGVIRYAPDSQIQRLEEFVPGVIRHRQFEYINPETGRIKRPRFPEKNNKAQVAAELAYKFAELGPVLVFCTQTNYVQSVAKALMERLKLQSRIGKEIPAYFRENADALSPSLADEYLGEGLLSSSLKSGIGVHYGTLPDFVRHAIETDFRDRKLRILVATNTLAQGVNLPVRTVIVHSCWRYADPIQERISARDYWNIAGRAGRAGEETEGLVIHIQTNQKDERDFEYYLRRREDVEPVESALHQKLIALMQNRLSPEALESDLDPEILAVLVEEAPEAISADFVQGVLDGSLVKIQAKRNKTSTKLLNQAFIHTANDVIGKVPDPEYRAVYSTTGLSTESCQIIREHIAENKPQIQHLFLEGKSEEREDMVKLLLPACLSLPEMEPARDFSGSYEELLIQWLGGTDIRDLMLEFADESNSAEEFGRFIDDLFRYKLPWGISGYSRIVMKVLGVERTALSDLARFFPSMVKFGVPDPVACWAMSVGLPVRRTALEIAATYQKEQPFPSYENFLEWLSRLSSEQLHIEYGLTGSVLETVTRAISISSANPLLKGYTSLKQFLPHGAAVQGIQYGNRSVSALRAKPGQSVDLVRDYDNTVDRNAIVVHLFNQEMGYLPRDVAQVLAPEMDTGANLSATIENIKRGRIPEVFVRIFQNE